VVVLGIDPGTATTGYGVVRAAGGRMEALDSGVIRTAAGVPLPERLRQIAAGVRELVRRHDPDMVAVEELFFNRNVQSAFAVGQARGVVLLAAAEAGVEVAAFTPLQVKMAVVGYGRAEKRQVQSMVQMILGLGKPPTPYDAADALAVAICCANSRPGAGRRRPAAGGGAPGDGVGQGGASDGAGGRGDARDGDARGGDGGGGARS